MKHCCHDIEVHIKSGEVALFYNAKFREYGIAVTDGGSSFQTITFCPWCGTRLPLSLRDKWFEVVCDQLGLEPGDKNIPAKYNSEEWWQDK